MGLLNSKSVGSVSEKFADVVSKDESYASRDANVLLALSDEDCALCSLAAKAIYDGGESFGRVLRAALQEKGCEVRREKYFDGKLEDDHDAEAHQPMSTLIYGASGQRSSTMLITFRGSVTANDWSANADTAPITSRLWHEELPNVLVHKGWDGEIWNHFSLTMGLHGTRNDGEPTVPELLQQFEVGKILFSGHSLGGALAQIATLTAMVKLPGIVGDDKSPPKVRAFVFASPMPFYFDKIKLSDKEEEVLESFRTNVHNVVFVLDVVPRIPGNHKWIKHCLEDFKALGVEKATDFASSYVPQKIASLFTKYLVPVMDRITHAGQRNLEMFAKYRHASTLLVFDFNDISSVDAFSSFMVSSCTPEEFAAEPYPRPDESFKAVLGIPAHSCLPEAVARNAFSSHTLALAGGREVTQSEVDSTEKYWFDALEEVEVEEDIMGPSAAASSGGHAKSLVTLPVPPSSHTAASASAAVVLPSPLPSKTLAARSSSRASGPSPTPSVVPQNFMRTNSREERCHSVGSPSGPSSHAAAVATHPSGSHPAAAAPVEEEGVEYDCGRAAGENDEDDDVAPLTASLLSPSGAPSQEEEEEGGRHDAKKEGEDDDRGGGAGGGGSAEDGDDDDNRGSSIAATDVAALDLPPSSSGDVGSSSGEEEEEGGDNIDDGGIAPPRAEERAPPSSHTNPPSTTAPSPSAIGTDVSFPPSVSSSSSAAAMAASSPPREERCKVAGGWGTYVGEFNGRGERHGWGTMKWDDGVAYEGEWKAGMRDGRGTYRYFDGGVFVSRFRAGFSDVKVGEGVEWSADRRTAWRLKDGMRKEEISLRKAEEIAKRIGLPVPE